MMKSLMVVITLSVTWAQVAHAQSTENRKKQKEDLGYLYILPVGDTPKIFREAQTTEDGVHLQKDPPPGERVPFSMSVNGASVPKSIEKLLKPTGGKYDVILTRNVASHPLLLTKSEEGFTLVNHPTGGGGSAISWSIKLPKSTEAVAVVTPKSYNRRPWSSPFVKIIDCSAKKIPGGSVYILNMSPYQVEVSSYKLRKKLTPGKSYLIKTSGKKKIPLSLRARQGKSIAYIHRNWVPVNHNNRQIMVIYGTPQSHEKIKVDLCKTKIPLKPNMQWLKTQYKQRSKKSSSRK